MPFDLKDQVHAARRGDRSAWRDLHAHHAPAVHAVLLARVDPVEADDLVQDTFVRALERLGQLQDDDAFGPWLLTIARNLAHSHHRTRWRWTSLPKVIPFLPPPRAEAQQALNAIRDLPEAYREILIMRLVEGMTGPEIAERTGRTPGSVRVSLHRGMKLLRAALGGHA
jgi:RNA polymerase sigma-70 factor (ECF subfamily)